MFLCIWYFLDQISDSLSVLNPLVLYAGFYCRFFSCVQQNTRAAAASSHLFTVLKKKHDSRNLTSHFPFWLVCPFAICIQF